MKSWIRALRPGAKPWSSQGLSFFKEELWAQLRDCVQVLGTWAWRLPASQASTAVLTPRGFTFRMGTPAQWGSLNSLGPTSLQKGQLPLPGGLLHCRPCQFLQRGWLTPRRSIWTCTPPAGQPRAPAARCQTPTQHCRALLHLPQQREEGALATRRRARPSHPPPAGHPGSSCLMDRGISCKSKKVQHQSVSGFSKLWVVSLKISLENGDQYFFKLRDRVKSDYIAHRKDRYCFMKLSFNFIYKIKWYVY